MKNVEFNDLFFSIFNVEFCKYIFQAMKFDAYKMFFKTRLKAISTQENKHGIAPDRNKMEPAQWAFGTKFSAPIWTCDPQPWW